MSLDDRDAVQSDEFFENLVLRIDQNEGLSPIAGPLRVRWDGCKY
jgi:hypothetical protein